MKHVIIIADGGADFPIAELGGRTPFDAARTPNLDALAASGRMGTAATTPPGFEAGSDVCSMCLLGYDPAEFHTGRAPLEAAALGLSLKPTDWIFRLNFVTVGEEGTPDEGLMVDHSAGAVTGAEGRELARGLVEHWKSVLPELAQDFELTPGVAYRNILVDRGGASEGRRSYRTLRTRPPHEIPRQRWADLVPKTDSDEASERAGAAAVNALMDAARAYLPRHPVSRARVAAGKRPANASWVWGQGLRPRMPSFKERFGGRSGAMITAVDLLAGIAAFVGWDRVDSPGISSFHDTDYAAQGRVTCGAIERYDVVCSHVESPDEASHQGDWKTKTDAITAIDEHIVGPVVRRLRERHADGWRVLVMPDHFTLVGTRKHDNTPVPWLIAGSDVRPSGPAARYNERTTTGPGHRRIDPGDGIMALFLDGRLD